MLDPIENLKQEEGYRREAYRCSEGYLTIGYGYNIDAGMPEDEAALLLEYRVSKIIKALERNAVIQGLHPDAEAVCVCMAYQLGVAGFLKFKNAIELMQSERYEEAADEILDSLWARQTPERAHRMADVLRLIYKG